MNTMTKVRIASRALAQVREMVDNEMSVQKCQVLLTVAEAGDAGIDITSLIQRLNLSKSAASKNVHSLSALTHDKRKGPDLVRIDVDPMNLKIRIARMTEKGKRVIEEVFS